MNTSSLIGYSSFLQVTRKCIKACISSNFGKIPPQITACRRNLVLTDSLAFAIDFWMLPRYIPEHFGIFSEV